MAMNPVLQALSNLFPLRHYFLIYVDQALNGYSMAYSCIQLYGIINIHDASLLCGSPLERSIGLL